MSLRSIQLWSLPPLACHPVAVFCEDIFDNILGSRLLRGKEEIVNNCPSRVAHGKWLADVCEPPYLPELRLKTLSYLPALLIFCVPHDVAIRWIIIPPPRSSSSDAVHAKLI